MTICPTALAVGCEKCPEFKFCPLTTVLGDQEEKDERDSVWKEKFQDEHLDKDERRRLRRILTYPTGRSAEPNG